MISIIIGKDSRTQYTTVTAKLRNVFMNYGDHIPSCPIEFSLKYLAVVSLRPGATNQTYPTATNLTKTYLLIYDVGEPLPSILSPSVSPYTYLTKVNSGLPMPSIRTDTNITKLKIIDIDNSTYLFVISKSYYPF